MNSIPDHVIRNDDTIRAFRDLFLNDDDNDVDVHFAFDNKDEINADGTGEETKDNDNLMGNHIEIGNIVDTFNLLVSVLLIRQVVYSANKII